MNIQTWSYIWAVFLQWCPFFSSLPLFNFPMRRCGSIFKILYFTFGGVFYSFKNKTQMYQANAVLQGSISVPKGWVSFLFFMGSNIGWTYWFQPLVPFSWLPILLSPFTPAMKCVVMSAKFKGTIGDQRVKVTLPKLNMDESQNVLGIVPDTDERALQTKMLTWWWLLKKTNLLQINWLPLN